MPFKAPSQSVSDPGCQTNWEGLQREDYASAAAQASTATLLGTVVDAVLDQGRRIQVIGNVRQASDTTAYGPGAVGVNVVYPFATVDLDAGTWLVYAQATAAASVADGKQLALWNGTAEIANTAGAVEAAAAGAAAALLTTTAIVTTTAQVTTVSMLVKRNGGSALTVGFSGGALFGEQRITAVRLI